MNRASDQRLATDEESRRPLVDEAISEPGSSLSARVRKAVGAPAHLPDVTIHTSTLAALSATALGARAYTAGNQIVFGAAQYQPETEAGRSLLRHELSHVIQNPRPPGSDELLVSAPDDPLERAAEHAAAVPGELQISEHRAGGPAHVARQPVHPGVTAEEPANPIASWVRSHESVVLVVSSEGTYVLPGTGLVWVPDAATQEKFQKSVAHFETDLGSLFEVPATGASGTRIFRAGRRTALVLDAGFDPRGVPAVVYLGEFQAAMASLGLSRISDIRPIHVHQDHISGLVDVITAYNVSADKFRVPSQYVGASAGMRRVVSTLQTTSNPALLTAGYGLGWTPGTTIRDKGGPGDILRFDYRLGDLKVEDVALRSAMAAVRTDPDLASPLTKVTRVTDQAKVVILGDLRGSHLARFRAAMEAQRPGSWNDFFAGVTTLSGFSHHLGRMEGTSTEIQGIMAVLDATLFRTGRLRIVEQTNLSDPTAGRARADTLELVRRLGTQVVMTEMPVPGAPSAVGASRSATTSIGPAASAPAPIPSALTDAIARLSRLVEARQTIESWRPWLLQLNKPQVLEALVNQLDQSTETLRQAVRPAVEAAVQVRTGGAKVAGGARDYSAASPRGATYVAAMGAIPGTTPAETAIGQQGFSDLAELRALPEREIPLRVAIYQAVTEGRYSDAAFAHMLGALDPATRDELLVGPRGGRSPQLKAFERVRSAYNFRQAVLGSGDELSIPRTWSMPARVAGRGVAGVLAGIEIWNSIGAPIVESVRISRQVNTSRNIAPFVRRQLFWQQFGALTKLVGVEDPFFGSPNYERSPSKVIAGINGNDWDAVFIEAPGLDDVEIIKLGLWLSYNVRNIDEFDLLFVDSAQDAVRWQSPTPGGWPHARWEVRVGHYETSGSNHVETEWFEHPTLTRFMQVYAERLIANTEKLLAERVAGRPPSADLEARLGYLSSVSWEEPRARATLKKPAATTDVAVKTTGRGSSWNPPPADLPRKVTWWSPPTFFVYDDGGGGFVLVAGADYNTYTVLRDLSTRKYWESATEGSLNTLLSREVGNEEGTVWIAKDLLDIQPLAAQPTR